jgi:hypothetical protein
VNRSCEALVASLRQRAAAHVRKARSSNNLRNIVRLIATASTLEHAARKLYDATDVNLHDIARILNPVADPGMHCNPESAQMRSTDTCPEDAELMSETCTLAAASRLSETTSRTEILNRFILRQRNVAHTGDRIEPSVGRPATRSGSNGMPTCKSIQKVSKTEGEP